MRRNTGITENKIQIKQPPPTATPIILNVKLSYVAFMIAIRKLRMTQQTTRPIYVLWDILHIDIYKEIEDIRRIGKYKNWNCRPIIIEFINKRAAKLHTTTITSIQKYWYVRIGIPIRRGTTPKKDSAGKITLSKKQWIPCHNKKQQINCQWKINRATFRSGNDTTEPYEEHLLKQPNMHLQKTLWN